MFTTLIINIIALLYKFYIMNMYFPCIGFLEARSHGKFYKDAEMSEEEL